jgi:hypothetical protein
MELLPEKANRCSLVAKLLSELPQRQKALTMLSSTDSTVEAPGFVLFG